MRLRHTKPVALATFDTKQHIPSVDERSDSPDARRTDTKHYPAEPSS
jgi:hypothetical protein